MRIAAEAYLRQCRCRNKAGDAWPLWSTVPADLQDYGTGISLYFRFTYSLSAVVIFAALITLPILAVNSTGTGLNDVDVGTGEHGFFAISSIGNFLGSDGSISLSRFDISPSDISFYIGVLDAVAVGAVLALAIWFERVVLPAAVRKEARTTVTPDAYSIFVSSLPRRLPADRHPHYEELLQQHFERQLNAEIRPDMQMQGWNVITKEEEFLHEPNPSSCFCVRQATDYRGRTLGSITAVEGLTALVRWPDASGRMGPQKKLFFKRLFYNKSDVQYNVNCIWPGKIMTGSMLIVAGKWLVGMCWCYWSKFLWQCSCLWWRLRNQ